MCNLIRNWSLLILLTATSFTGVARAAAPVINVQGRLNQGLGDTLATSSYEFTFTIYAEKSGGVPLWTEKRRISSVAGGLFIARLGTTNPIPDSALSVHNRWLGLRLGEGGEMIPRTRLEPTGGNVWTATLGESDGRGIRWGLQDGRYLGAWTLTSVTSRRFTLPLETWIKITGKDLGHIASNTDPYSTSMGRYGFSSWPRYDNNTAMRLRQYWDYVEEFRKRSAGGSNARSDYGYYGH